MNWLILVVFSIASILCLIIYSLYVKCHLIPLCFLLKNIYKWIKCRCKNKTKLLSGHKIYFSQALSVYPKSNNKKKSFSSFEPAKMHCWFLDVTNAFQMKIWLLSNFICYKGDRILSNTKMLLKSAIYNKPTSSYWRIHRIVNQIY